MFYWLCFNSFGLRCACCLVFGWLWFIVVCFCLVLVVCSAVSCYLFCLRGFAVGCVLSVVVVFAVGIYVFCCSLLVACVCCCLYFMDYPLRFFFLFFFSVSLFAFAAWPLFALWLCLCLIGCVLLALLFVVFCCCVAVSCVLFCLFWFVVGCVLSVVTWSWKWFFNVDHSFFCFLFFVVVA